MTEPGTFKWMSDAIAKACRLDRFSADGHLPPVDPGLHVEGVGPIKLPLKAKTAKQLIAAGKVAPYGKGTKTLTDKNVRNSFELDAKQLQLSDDWNRAIAEVTQSVAMDLGLLENQLQANLYKLLLYERGGFFLPHRDSEKLGRMIGTLVVVLPTSFSGGELIVRHESAEQMFRFGEASSEQSANFVAFYADCEHEVRRITRGRRLTLTYNLTLKKPRKGKSKDSNAADSEVDSLGQSINSWIAARPGEPLVFALEHQYTERGLAIDLLKGNDRSLAKIVLAAAKNTNCRVHLAQVARHLLQFADDGSFGRERHWGYHSVDPGELTVGESYEDDLTGDCWVDTQGKRQKFGPLPLNTSAIVSSTPLDDWEPTSEEYEGYTGNAGNTLDRWYHRSAIVIWHETNHFDVLARAGARSSIELFLSMTSKLKKTAQKRLEAARSDCLLLARAIINRWPPRSYRHYQSDDQPPFSDFATELLTLDDPAAIGEFLSALAHRDKITEIDKVVLAACRKYGLDVFANQFESLLTQVSRHDSDIALRDIKWLSVICCDRKLDKDRDLLHRLLSIATDRYCESYVRQESRFRRIDTVTASKALPLLVKALLATEASASLEKLIEAIRSVPKNFSLKTAQIPCLNTLVPWSMKRDGKLHVVLKKWLEEVRTELEFATQEQPSPPTDWARPAEVECDCQFCEQLNEFLRDPECEVTRIKAREDRRDHVESNIREYRCDVSHKLERIGSPHSLVLTKTTGSHEHALKQYATYVKLLKALPSE